MPEYCSLADIKQRMPELGTTDDTLLTSLVYAVSGYFDTVTGRRFDAATEVRTLSGTGTKQLFVRPPLAAVPTLVRVRDNVKDTTWNTVPTGDVKLMPEGRRTGDPILWLELIDQPTGTDNLWPEADSSVEITGSWGRTGIPDDIREACIQTVINLYRARGSSGNDFTASGGTYMPEIPKAVPAFAYSVLRAYKRLVYA